MGVAVRQTVCIKYSKLIKVFLLKGIVEKSNESREAKYKSI